MCFEVGLCKRIILPFAVIRSVKKKNHTIISMIPFIFLLNDFVLSYFLAFEYLPLSCLTTSSVIS